MDKTDADNEELNDGVAGVPPAISMEMSWLQPWAGITETCIWSPLVGDGGHVRPAHILDLAGQDESLYGVYLGSVPFTSSRCTTTKCLLT